MAEVIGLKNKSINKGKDFLKEGKNGNVLSRESIGSHYHINKAQRVNRKAQANMGGSSVLCWPL